MLGLNILVTLTYFQYLVWIFVYILLIDTLHTLADVFPDTVDKCSGGINKVPLMLATPHYLVLHLCLGSSHHGAEIVAGARFLTGHAPPSVSLRIVEAFSAVVRARDQPREEAPGPAGEALAPGSDGHLLGPPWSLSVASGGPDRCLQQLISTVF